MGLNKLNYLYQQVLFDHVKYPYHQHALTNPTHHMELLNPSCGDMIQVELEVDGDRIVEVGFTGNGCTISMASASMMAKALEGKSIDEADDLIARFDQIVGGVSVRNFESDEKNVLDDQLDDATFLEGVKQFPARYNCAILAWKGAQLGLHPDQQIDLAQGIAMNNKTEGND